MYLHELGRKNVKNGDRNLKFGIVPPMADRGSGPQPGPESAGHGQALTRRTPDGLSNYGPRPGLHAADPG